MDWGVLAVVALVWTAAAIGLGLLLGRMIRRRDEQKPTRPAEAGEASQDRRAA
ncbi:hypothetical protein Q9R08_07365 [Microbacterium sp. QXD-8]|uniref:Uncharacterized protein n=1 Tax=Microbacterium psychrotolerans TaxID=3068321 RepID=A0ABU0YZM6_9MICO|nr:hypothetical protein [Microbacterium sp. QXD-8]MDQ7877787.1 hypothetical protein [Microbacterium sp. QXD-8]